MFKNPYTYFVLFALLFLSVGAYFADESRRPSFKQNTEYDSSVVKVSVGSGHGSGVYIGDGIIITAAHVLSGAKDGKVKLKTKGGNILDGEVLWVNKSRDIAAIKPSSLVGLQAASLSCIDPEAGEAVIAEGNPGMVEFFIAKGYISDSKKHEMLPWKEALIVDLSIAPGMSGGPVFDETGYVVGITVGVLATQLGFAPSITGVGVIVPGSTVCELLGR